MNAQQIIALARRWRELDKMVNAETVKQYEETYQYRLERDDIRAQLYTEGLDVEQSADGVLSLHVPD